MEFDMDNEVLAALRKLNNGAIEEIADRAALLPLTERLRAIERLNSLAAAIAERSIAVQQQFLDAHQAGGR